MFSTLERSFLALDWDPDLKKRYFDENAAEVSHHSFLLFLSLIDHSFIIILICFYQICLASKKKKNWLYANREKVCFETAFWLSV